MLNRLMKYDLRKMLKFLIVFLLLASFFGILTRLLGELGDSLAISIIKGICNGSAISMMCSLLINCFMRSWVLFRSNLFGDESYLTHTLPIKREVHYTAKFLTAAVSLLFSMLGIILVLFITYWTKDLWSMIKAFLTPFSEHLGISLPTIFAFFFFLLFLEFFNGIQVGFTGILIGHRFQQGKILWSVIFGFAGYMISQTITLVGMLIIALFDSRFFEIFRSNDLMSFSPETLVSVFLAGTAFYAIFCIGAYFLNVYLLKKGVNVE